MATVTTIQEVMTNTGLVCTNNGATSITLQENFPVFDSTFSTDYLVDLLIVSMNGFTSGETFEVLIDGISQGTFSVGTSPTKALWLSELLGLATRDILSSKPSTQTIQFNFSSTKLLKFILVSAKASDYISAIDTYNNISTISNTFVLAETDIQSKDENSLSALRSCIDESKTTITGNGTNTINITNAFSSMGTALDKTLVVDSLITINNGLNIGTQIYIKKDNNYLTTFTATSNIKAIWLSDLLGLTSRDFLYTKSATTEVYELTFIYDQSINCQVITGLNSNFTTASVASVQLTQNLYELANANALDGISISVDDCNFTVTYDSDNKVKSATFQINDQQEINYSFITDNSGDTPKYLVKQSNVDNLYNIEIALIMDSESIINQLNMLREFAREMYNKNSSTTTS